MFNPSIFKAYDIRGEFGKDFDFQFSYDLAQALVYWLKSQGHKQPVVAVGHDARLSSPGLYQNFIRGLENAGVQSYKLGLITTPMSYFTGYHYAEVTATVMITASHNPRPDNGFKMCVNARSLTSEELIGLRNYIVQDIKYYYHPVPSLEKNIFKDYINFYKKQFSPLKGKILIDCGNGASGVVAKQLYEALGLDVTVLFEKPDGHFPNHHPDPTIESNLTALMNELKTKSYDFALALDGDADRGVIVTREGRMVAADLLAAFLTKGLKASPVVLDVKCSDLVFNYLSSQGFKPVMWKSGHSLTKSKVKEEQASLGAELSGHIFFNDRTYNLDDGLYIGLRVAELILSKKHSLEKFIKNFPTTFSTEELRIETTEGDSIINKIKSKYSSYKQNHLDGVRVSWPGGWFLVRKSNTQPMITMRIESSSKEELIRIQEDIFKLL